MNRISGYLTGDLNLVFMVVLATLLVFQNVPEVPLQTITQTGSRIYLNLKTDSVPLTTPNMARHYRTTEERM